MWRGVLKVAVIAGFAFLLLAFGAIIVVRSREKANRLRCMDNLRQTGWLAMWQYADPGAAFPKGPKAPDVPEFLPGNSQLDPNRTFPPGTLANAALAPDHRLSWMVILLPYLGKDDLQKDLQKKFDLTQAWDAEVNAGPIATLVPMFVCPSQFQRVPADTPIVTNYIGMAGLGPDAPTLPQTDPRAGFFRYDDATKVGSVQRGLSRTITILETPANLGPWAAGGASTVRGLDPATQPYFGPAGPFGGHPNGAYAAFADGSVRLQSNSISPRVLELLSTLAAGLQDE
jgi:prepilin-type processing-associated H-X9-DG protein